MITKNFYGRYEGLDSELSSLAEPIRNGSLYFASDRDMMYIKTGASVVEDEYHVRTWDPGTWVGIISWVQG